MTTSELLSILLILGVVGLLIARQIVPRQVTMRTATLPGIALLVAGALWATNLPSFAAVAAMVVCVALGVVMGAISATFRHVWRAADGTIMMRGDWRMLAAILALLAVRVALHFILGAMAGAVLSVTDLNNAFIGMLLGSFAASAALVLLQARPLVGGDLNALPAR